MLSWQWPVYKELAFNLKKVSWCFQKILYIIIKELYIILGLYLILHNVRNQNNINPSIVEMSRLNVRINSYHIDIICMWLINRLRLGNIY